MPSVYRKTHAYGKWDNPKNAYVWKFPIWLSRSLSYNERGIKIGDGHLVFAEENPSASSIELGVQIFLSYIRLVITSYINNTASLPSAISVPAKLCRVKA